MANSENLLAAGLLNVCKQLLGRVRVLEEVVKSHPDLLAEYQKKQRFLAAFEEDEYTTTVGTLKEWLKTLEEQEDLFSE
ncbi:MAG: hypothetical protein AUK47_08700 [Deltaproteobacteria bacterium CG2_30_63_29]|nr:MAG: hypothetical protein AUK47_08700 [Deltaproteobacteria bacterium CG2_30_63_29]PIV98133.1 MAG: hypothetical protein COW42_16515 [Deltaproteobacteria bacterium CG17_big_fil_post_rev_8_21_14_2_50_63_7]PJB46810.1 MAG: hypothetical protein CO108_05200 [Deltaproteobacteria bacterium CG_4_9_14_3_um_filter_63_12]